MLLYEFHDPHASLGYYQLACILHLAQMGDLEGFLFGAYSAITSCAGTVDRVGGWYVCIFTVFPLIKPSFFRGGAYQACQHRRCLYRSRLSATHGRFNLHIQ